MSFPVLIGEVARDILVDAGMGEMARAFPFVSWATAMGFRYPEESREFFTRCGSAAEAYLIRPFTLRDGVTYPTEGRAVAGNMSLDLQVTCGTYSIDAVVRDGTSALAMEVDGMAFHHRTKEQIAADYIRQRRIVLRGYTVIRFTAQEAFATPDECWSQIEHILRARRGKP